MLRLGLAFLREEAGIIVMGGSVVAVEYSGSLECQPAQPLLQLHTYSQTQHIHYTVRIAVLHARVHTDGNWLV